jgi:hypothetical protein
MSRKGTKAIFYTRIDSIVLHFFTPTNRNNSMEGILLNRILIFTFLHIFFIYNEHNVLISSLQIMLDAKMNINYSSSLRSFTQISQINISTEILVTRLNGVTRCHATHIFLINLSNEKRCCYNEAKEDT